MCIYVFLAGGYTRPFEITEAGGSAINRAWMFDGYYWVELANMFEVRSGYKFTKSFNIITLKDL